MSELVEKLVDGIAQVRNDAVEIKARQLTKGDLKQLHAALGKVTHQIAGVEQAAVRGGQIGCARTVDELRGVVNQAVDAMQAAEKNSVDKLNAEWAKQLFWRDWKHMAIGAAVALLANTAAGLTWIFYDNVRGYFGI